MAAHFAVVLVAWVLAYASTSDRALIPFRNSSKVVDAQSKSRRWNLYDFALVVTLVTFSSARYLVGTDYFTYLSLYERINPADPIKSFSQSPVEVGYTTLSILLRQATSFPYAVFWASSLLTVAAVYVAIRRLSDDLPFSILMFLLLGFYVLPFNLVRQGIAVGLILLAYSFYSRNRRIYYTLGVLAGLFHYTAWFVFVIQWAVLRWRPSARTVLHLVGGVLSVGALMVAVNSVEPALVSSALSSVNPRYGDYFEGARSGVGTYLIIATRLALLGLAYVLLRNSAKGFSASWRKHGTQYAYVALGVCFLIIGTQAVNVGRVDHYFGIYLVLLIPNLLTEVERPLLSSQPSLLQRVEFLVTSPRSVYIGFGLFGSVYFAMFIANFANLIPYQTYFWQ